MGWERFGIGLAWQAKQNKGVPISDVLAACLCNTASFCLNALPLLFTVLIGIAQESPTGLVKTLQRLLMERKGKRPTFRVETSAKVVDASRFANPGEQHEHLPCSLWRRHNQAKELSVEHEAKCAHSIAPKSPQLPRRASRCFNDLAPDTNKAIRLSNIASTHQRPWRPWNTELTISSGPFQVGSIL